MTLTKRLLVRDSIEKLGNDIDSLSQIFFRELFRIDMNLKRVFPGNVVFLNRKFANMMATFKNTKYLEKISASIEKMGQRHLLNYGVQIDYFEPAQLALLKALKTYFGDDFSSELEDAWISVYWETADIMKRAMQEADRRLSRRAAYDEICYDLELLREVGGEPGIRRVHQRFYDVMFDEPWLGQFFYGKSKEALINKQTHFMTAAFGGENKYSGDTPAFVHMHMFITDEMSDLRQKILRQAILDEGFSESVAERWLKVDDSFRESIVKGSVDECVMKCRGQIPVVAKKPLSYKPKW
ncbi:MAG: globin domain-containing protein [Gammaproteobacteria bacterium]